MGDTVTDDHIIAMLQLGIQVTGSVGDEDQQHLYNCNFTSTLSYQYKP